MPHRVDLPLKCIATFELLINQSFCGQFQWKDLGTLSLDTTIMLRLENRACDLKRLEITQRLILGIFGSLLALLVCGQDFRDIQALICTRMAEHCSRMMGWSQ